LTRSNPGAESPLDLLFVDATIIDPTTRAVLRRDVGVSGDKVVSVEGRISRNAKKVIRARGCLLAPGLFDLHTHIYPHGPYWGVDPRAIAWRTGVTSWIDCGSAGAFNVAALQHLSDAFAPLEVRAFLNISSIGLVAETGEALRDDLCDWQLCSDLIQEHRDFVVGVKCRLDRYSSGPMGLVPLERAIRAAETTGLPVMTHIGAGPPEIDEVLELLRPGDIVTHCATGQSMTLIKNGQLRASAARARERGVLFDVGHGSGAFSFRVAETMVAAGFLPDLISSDVHQRSIFGPAFDLPTCMSKFLALGMPLDDVIRAVTVNPARAIGDTNRAAYVTPGQIADLALFEIESGDFALFDAYLDRRDVDRILVNRGTFVAGKELPPVTPTPPAPWIVLTTEQRELLQRSADSLRRPWTTYLADRRAYVPAILEGPP
jgi:dihydroorotase